MTVHPLSFTQNIIPFLDDILKKATTSFINPLPFLIAWTKDDLKIDKLKVWFEQG